MFRRQIVVAAPPVPPAAPRRYVRRTVRFSIRFSIRLLLVAVVVAVGLLAAAFVWSVPAPTAEARSAGVNALWAGSTWVTEPHRDEEHDRLATRLRTAQISDVMVDVGPLDGEGEAPPERTPRAAAFIGALHDRVPGIRVQASLRQVLPSAGGPLRLYDRAVRERIAATARAYLELGFDGVHYAVAPVRPGDRDLLDLLDRTRELTRARGAVLSVALEQLQAHPLVASLAMPLVRSYAAPDTRYLSAVADRVDQLAVMTWDSSMPTRSSFAAYVAWQTARTAEVVGDRVTLFMGVPTSGEPAWDHHPWAETTGAALHGLRRGLDSLGTSRVARQPIGAALHTDGTTSASEWQTFIDEWVKVD